ncbi:hypothetical protein QA601_14210 [Chitinispirillales bacterium ANBcel5]|uniref:DNA polymerase Y family protein n=1 Tax=Cellulosispirillum alkaliphilum TaxID=3039283 RepID=UPI002A4ECED6|nr:hypothetical protein [Chitinispirillales bacterium ANBcel5]
MDRSVLHVNVVNFYISVARALEPGYRSYPVAVISAGASRRVVLDVSSEGYMAGVRRGMAVEAARRICRDLVITNPLPSAYEKAQRYMLKQVSQLSPRAEIAGPGHLFVDLTGTRRLLGPSVDIGDRLRKTIQNQLRFESAIGIASNRLVSKVATRVIKPTGLCSVLNGCEEEFMAPLPVTMLPGVERAVLEQLLQFNIRMIHDMLEIAPASLAAALGPAAFDICAQARGIDNTPVREIEQPPPVVRELETLQEQTNDEQLIRCVLFTMVSRAGRKIRTMGLAAGKARLTITYADGATASKRIRLSTPLRNDLILFDMVKDILSAIFTRRVRLSELDLEFSELTFPYGQIDLFLDDSKQEGLTNALDSIKKNFGDKSIRFWGREVA